MMPAAVRGPVMGPACRACANESERVRQFGGKKSRPALCVATPIFREVSVAMMGLSRSMVWVLCGFQRMMKLWQRR